jgi:hypothetical protein
MFRLLVTALSLSACLLAQSAANRLEGCPDPAKLALALKTLQTRKWANLSFDSVEDVWPTSLRGGGACDPHCILLVSEGRIIRNEIECGESLHFDTGQDAGGLATTSLESIVLRYVTRTRADRDAVEKTLIRSLKMGDDVKDGFGVATGYGRFRDITWTDHEPERRSCDLGLRYARVNRKWLLIFDLSCDPDKGSASSK